jgi:hypothetical protein
MHHSLPDAPATDKPLPQAPQVNPGRAAHHLYYRPYYVQP